MEIKFIKTHENAKLPTLAHPNQKLGDNLLTEIQTGDTGFDIYCSKDTIIPATGIEGISYNIVPTDIQVAYITPGFWFRIEAKSGLGFKYGLWPHPGIIDNSYRGDLGVKIYNFSNKEYTFNIGDKIAQIVIYPLIHASIGWTDKVTDTKRGVKGFGSTGK